MKIVFGTGLHKAQLVMELDITQPDEKKLADRIMNGKSITSIQHFIAGTDTPEGAVIIWNDKQPIKKIIGQWQHWKSVSNGNFTTNYFRFTPRFEVKSFFIEIADMMTDEEYLYYTFNNYTKL